MSWFRVLGLSARKLITRLRKRRCIGPEGRKELSFGMHPWPESAFRRSRGYARRGGHLISGPLIALLLLTSVPVLNLPPPSWWRRGFPRKRYDSFAEVELLSQLGALICPQMPLEEMFRSFPGKDLPDWGGHYLSPDLALYGVLKDPEAALFIEYDGFYRHFEPRVVEADQRKTRALLAYAPRGSRVLRLSHEEREVDDLADSLVIPRWWPRHRTSLTASLLEVVMLLLGIPSLGLRPDLAEDLKRLRKKDFRLSEAASLFSGNATLAGDPGAKLGELKEFLISRDLSEEQVAQAVSRYPKLLGYSIGENLQPTVDWLQGLSLSDGEVAKAVSRFPQLLGLSIRENLQPTVDWLQGLGLSDGEVAKAVSRCPQLLGYSIRENLQPTVDWLQGLGLTDGEVAKAVVSRPQLLGLSIRENLQPTVDWLQGLGLSDGEVAKAVSRCPQLLGYSIGENLQPTVDWLQGLGLTDSEVAKAVVSRPQLLGLSIGENLQPTVDWLQGLGLSAGEVAKAVSRCPQLLGYSIWENLQPTVDWLQGLGLSDGEVAKAVSRCPQLLGYSIRENLQPTVDWLQGLGLSDGEVAKAVSRCPHFVGLSIRENLQPTVDWLQGLGLSDGEVAKAVSRCPQLLGCSIGENLQPTVDWLQGLGLSDGEVAKAVSRCPQLLGYSIGENLQPTVDWLQGLGLSDGLDIRHLVVRFPIIMSLSLSNNLKPKMQLLLQYFSPEEAISLLVADPRIFSYSALRLRERLAVLVSSHQLAKFSAALRMTESRFESSYGVQTCKCLHWQRLHALKPQFSGLLTCRSAAGSRSSRSVCWRGVGMSSLAWHIKAVLPTLLPLHCLTMESL